MTPAYISALSMSAHSAHLRATRRSCRYRSRRDRLPGRPDDAARDRAGRPRGGGHGRSEAELSVPDNVPKMKI
jgi:hypothetical protein